jgi:hypothetical protein
VLRFAFALPLIGHGLAHLSGFTASWTSSDAGYGDKPWIFSSGVTLSSTVGRVFGLLWLVAAVVLAASGVGAILRQEWWLPLAVVGSVLSLVVIVPWWNTVPPGAKLGAVFDVIVIAVLASPLREQIISLIG